MKIAVLSAGAWGTALAIAFAGRNDVCLWARESDVVDSMRQQRENTRFLPGHPLPENLEVSGDFAAVVMAAELLVLATPLAGLRATLQRIAELVPGKPVVWVCKGLEAGTAKLPHVIAEEVLPAGTAYGALSGPSFAEEVANGLPTAVTLAANNGDFARDTAKALHSPRLRIYANTDLVGVEIGGAVKNVIAIACGVAEGKQLGEGARAALVTRGFAELVRLGVAMGARAETLNGLCGLGDLVLTCVSLSSRNTSLGAALGQGRALADIVGERRSVAEGVASAPAVAALAARHGVDMPICAAVDAILAGRLSVDAAIDALLARPFSREDA